MFVSGTKSTLLLFVYKNNLGPIQLSAMSTNHICLSIYHLDEGKRSKGNWAVACLLSLLCTSADPKKQQLSHQLIFSNTILLMIPFYFFPYRNETCSNMLQLLQYMLYLQLCRDDYIQWITETSDISGGNIENLFGYKIASDYFHLS